MSSLTLSHVLPKLPPREEQRRSSERILWSFRLLTDRVNVRSGNSSLNNKMNVYVFLSSSLNHVKTQRALKMGRRRLYVISRDFVALKKKKKFDSPVTGLQTSEPEEVVNRREGRETFWRRWVSPSSCPVRNSTSRWEVAA